MNVYEIINIAAKNMIAKKSRIFFTITAISLAIGFLVLLISIGYGLQNIVTSNIATVTERNTLNILPSFGQNVALDDSVVEKLKTYKEIDLILPIMSIASNIEYNGSTMEVVPNGITYNYFDRNKEALKIGKLFENDSQTDEIIINDVLAQSLQIEADNLANQDISISYLYMNDTNTVSTVYQGTMQSPSKSYKVIGVVSEGDTPSLYVPIKEIKDIGISEYTQINTIMMTENKAEIENFRSNMEILGFETISVLDTIAQVNQVFNYIRLFLMIIGLVALGVAMLGMFNTLTVSLLERTREIGYLKAIGMRSFEIKLLFISEAMLISIIGGIIGILLGVITGQILSLIISIISISQGNEYLNISYTPLYFILIVICFVSLFGYLTGIYPAKRAQNISILDAMRYE